MNSPTWHSMQENILTDDDETRNSRDVVLPENYENKSVRKGEQRDYLRNRGIKIKAIDRIRNLNFKFWEHVMRKGILENLSFTRQILK